VPILSARAQATVFINEVFINPPSSMDDRREFIELLGTPGRKLDGYAIAVLNGTDEKLYDASIIPPPPVPAPEIDEFFSLDGLALGRNGILVLGIWDRNGGFYYPESLSDSNFVRWTTLWNGGRDVPGQQGNNGSFTIMLIRNRPGQTEADPCNLDGLLWGKETTHDAEFIPQGGDNYLWGNGNLDRGDPNGMGGNTLEMTGLSTVGDLTDDLEIVDEVSFEDLHGWEYDTDGRHVDSGSTLPELPYRHVHALDDPAGFNPDALSRVDYRTKGDGWTPADGGTGEMADGNNWQDTATEQWIRGENVAGYLPEFGLNPVFFYENTANLEPNTVQPYETHVPLWLYDGNVPDYDFASANTYQIAAGRINLLAVPFIPGDRDRDGLCDANDISKIAAVFGNDDWIFSNSFFDAPEGDSGDPATQTRPWDVDATGDNGIEASDLQWTLNFQGNTTGQIVGVQYDSNIPAPDINNVHLNPNTAVECNVTTSVNIPSGRSLTALRVDDIVEVTVSGQVTAGPNTATGQENGIMQYVHDVAISSGGIVKVTLIEPLGSFSTTRASLEELQGTDGDLGADLINGFTTSFTGGLSGPAGLYRLTLQAIGEGSADITISPAAAAKFAASTPHGLKVGHTDSQGDPNSSIYPALLPITVGPAADLDGDGLVDLNDLDIMCENWLEIDPNLVLLSSFLVHWKMNDDANDTTVADSSGNGNHGTFNDANDPNTNAHSVPGKINGALTFDGSDDFVDVGDVVGTGAYTKVAWVRREAGSYFHNIISGDTGTHAFWAPSGASFKLSAGHNHDWYRVQDSNALDVDVWYHVAVTYDLDSGAMVLYKNGVEVNSATGVGPSPASTTTYIGKYDGGYYFKGSIDNVMIFDEALTAEEIGFLYSGGSGTETITVGEVEGDLSGDAMVDMLDLAELAEVW
jgi:hypothetical protein